jgi:hypothetical protein
MMYPWERRRLAGKAFGINTTVILHSCRRGGGAPRLEMNLYSLEELDMGLWFLMKNKRGTPEWIDHLMNYGTKLTSQIAEAEARGDARTVNSLIRKKNQVNRWKREITYVGR